MFGLPGPQEFLFVIAIVAVLTMTGLWPRIIHGLRELRGDNVGPAPGPSPSMADTELCYKLLGVTPSAPWPEIEKAYRTKAKKHHPDLGGDEDAMRALNDAYAILKRTRKP